MIVGKEEIHIKPLYLILMKNQLGNVKQCRTLIKHHYVFVNGNCVDDINYLVQTSDHITVHGQTMNSQPFLYLMMNKPKGYICANSDQHYPCVVDLTPYDDCFCIGRLDVNTTGLLLLTNDRSFLKKLLLPENHIEKTYFVEVQYPLKKCLIQKFSEGVVIDENKVCLPAQMEIIDDYHCYVTLYEGKYHQVKKMFLSCENKVIELKRITFAGIHLDETLKVGEFRNLNENELQLLQ